MLNRLAIDTGAPRSINGHLISGALASGAIASAMNYNKYTKGEITKKEAIQNSVKLTVQGGIATSSAIAAANYLGEGKIFKMLTAVSIGAMGVYAVEKINEKVEQTNLVELNEGEE